MRRTNSRRWLLPFRSVSYNEDEASELMKRPVRQRTLSCGGTGVYLSKDPLDEIPLVPRIQGVVIVRMADTEW